jgi:hypothetical protein
MQLNITTSLVEDDETILLVKSSVTVRGGFFTDEAYAQAMHEVRGALLDNLGDVHKQLLAERRRADECVAAHLDGNDPDDLLRTAA